MSVSDKHLHNNYHVLIENYHKNLSADKKYYFLGVKEVVAFEAYYQNKDGKSTVEVGFYIN